MRLQLNSRLKRLEQQARDQRNIFDEYAIFIDDIEDNDEVIIEKITPHQSEIFNLIYERHIKGKDLIAPIIFIKASEMKEILDESQRK